MGWVVVGVKTGVLIGLIAGFHWLGILSAAGQNTESGARLRPMLTQPYGVASAIPTKTRSHNRRTQPFDANGNFARAVERRLTDIVQQFTIP